MSGLFSHPSGESDVPEPRPPLRAAVAVPAPLDHAWAGFTEHLHLWWPADELSRWGADSFFDLEDNALVETSADDDENVWGEVTGSQAGEWLELQWRHVGSASTTLLRLVLEGSSVPAGEPAGLQGSALEGGPSGTSLAVVHSGWSEADPLDVYEFYRGFWPLALSRYRRFMGGS
jgi:hypothetical protein